MTDFTASYHLSPVAAPDQDSTRQLYENLNQFNQQHAGEFEQAALARYVRNQQDQVIGGIYGRLAWDWLHIDLLWLAPELRGGGLGRQLLDSLEAHALTMGIHRFQTNTTSFQALDFYQACGYQVFGQLADLPPGHTSYYLKKVVSRPE